MNYFNKTILNISLALAIPLSTHANWFGDLANSILVKKKTIAASIALSGALSFGAVQLVNWFYSNWPERMTVEQMLNIHPNLNPGILFAAERGFKEMNRTISAWKYTSICLAIALSIRLISKAHEKNLFGEKA